MMQGNMEFQTTVLQITGSHLDEHSLAFLAILGQWDQNHRQPCPRMVVVGKDAVSQARDERLSLLW